MEPMTDLSPQDRKAAERVADVPPGMLSAREERIFAAGMAYARESLTVTDEMVRLGVSEAHAIATGDPEVIEGERQDGESPEHFTVRRILEAAGVREPPAPDTEIERLITAIRAKGNLMAPGVTPVDMILDELTLAEGEVIKLREHVAELEGDLVGWRERCERVADLEVELDKVRSLLDGSDLELRPGAESTTAVEETTERAWRNGWGSALNAVRAARSLAERHNQLTATEWQAAGIVNELLGKMVDIIDGTTEVFVESQREIGFAIAEVAEPSKDQPQAAKARGLSDEDGPFEEEGMKALKECPICHGRGWLSVPGFDFDARAACHCTAKICNYKDCPIHSSSSKDQEARP